MARLCTRRSRLYLKSFIIVEISRKSHFLLCLLHVSCTSRPLRRLLSLLKPRFRRSFCLLVIIVLRRAQLIRCSDEEDRQEYPHRGRTVPQEEIRPPQTLGVETARLSGFPRKSESPCSPGDAQERRGAHFLPPCIFEFALPYNITSERLMGN